MRIFFDPAFQHFVLYSEGRFFTWVSTDSEVELLLDLGKVYRTTCGDVNNVILARLSLDRVTCHQLNDTKLSVIELRTFTKWTIEIKNPHDNRIIDGGLIWSQHGGGSEDLIIVAAEGLKYANKHNQCTSYRVLNQGNNYHARFWYEPRCDVLLSNQDFV